jgi:hypothetical protein
MTSAHLIDSQAGELQRLPRLAGSVAFLAAVGVMMADVLLIHAAPPEVAAASATASSTGPDSSPQGALDGDRFSVEPAASWRGKAGEPSWWWQVQFPEPRPIGAILQIMGDHPLYLRNAPKRYTWQVSLDGTTWDDLKETATADERRTFRAHRLERSRQARYLRLSVQSAEGDFPTLREVELFADPKAAIPFEPWSVVVSTTGDTRLPGEGPRFVRVAQSCKGWEKLQAQIVWLGDFREAFVSAEPRPLCAFLTGNTIDWCQQKREHWRGTQEVLRAGHLPMWASCGGAQGLAILAETGVDRPWDCPHCRDPKDPKLPIYTHIAHSAMRPCGDYSACTFERGPHNILKVADDPVFEGLPREFRSMESHCGQIEWPPRGWMLIATRGSGSQTKTQCLRVKDRYIYAAQFHLEMEGTPESSRTIMGNFLRLAEKWGGYNPQAAAVSEPSLFPGDK